MAIKGSEPADLTKGFWLVLKDPEEFLKWLEANEAVVSPTHIISSPSYQSHHHHHGIHR